MIVKKIFDISTKKVEEKAPYCKPKYKSYKQLLGLDRPKKIVRQSSDDEDNDFLENMMKKQQNIKKERKKSRGIRSSASEKLSGSKVPTQQSQLNVQATDYKLNQTAKLPDLIKTKQNANDLQQLQEVPPMRQPMIYQTQQSQNEQSLNHQISNQNSPQLEDQNAKKKINVIKRKKTQETNLWSILQLNPHKNIRKTQEQNKAYTVLKLSYQEPNKSLKNTFFTSIKSKKSDGFKSLQKQVHLNNFSQTKRNSQTKVNPQKNEVQHQIALKKNPNSNTVSYLSKTNNMRIKSGSLNKIQMAQTSKKQKFTRSLFKTFYQEQLFLRTLRRQ